MPKLSALRSAALVSVTAAATTLLIQACGGGAIAQSDVADPIEGVWASSVTTRDCTSGAALGQPFPALLSFHHGGGLDIDNASARATRGNIYGVWRLGTGAGAAYQANVIHQRFNTDGSYAGTNRVNRTVTLSADGKSFTATLVAQILDPAGAVTAQFCPTETGTRVNL